MDDNKTKKGFPVQGMEEWLYQTNIKCHSLKSHMDYMKLACHNIQQEILKPKNTFDVPSYHNPKIKLSDTDESVTSRQMNCNDSLEKSSNATYVSINDNGNLENYSPSQSLKLRNILPKVNVQYRDKEKIENKSIEIKLEAEKDDGSYEQVQSPRIQCTPLLPIHKDFMCEKQNDTWHDSYQQHLTEYSPELTQNMDHSAKFFKESIIGNKNKLNIHGNVKNGTGGKNKVYKKNEKKEKIAFSTLSSKKNSVSKIDDIVSLKLKKRRRKLHNANSKSTVATNCTGRKDLKKRKQKGVINTRHTSKYPQASNEVVEIYHNSALKDGSTSLSFINYSKLDSHTNYSNKLSLGANKQQNIHPKTKCDDTNYQCNYNTDKGNGSNSPLKQCQSKQKIEEKGTNFHNQNCVLEFPTAPVHAMKKCNSHQCQQSILPASYCNPMITHSYEMPTLASKLKRVNRTYFSRFTIKNIPFVVGTSVTPSHNLGLNIQQVLSIMKTRQSTLNGITPLLIRKLSRGMKPVSPFTDQMNDQYTKLPPMNSRLINTFVHKANSFLNEPFNLFENESVSLTYGAKTLNNFNLNVNLTNMEETAINGKIEHESFLKKDTQSENQLNAEQVLHNTDNAKVLKVFSSQQNVKTQMKIQNTHQIQSMTCRENQNSNGIREVLINLHDQFEEMNTKYEKLQIELEKSDDKKLKGEVSQLEKELSIKEDEINAVINLYKEVMALKQQMRLLQEKNSYVCISSDVPIGLSNPHSPIPFTLTKSNGTILQQKHPRKGSTIITTREPTSLRLAGLLRQIQTFQKQLRLSS
ncbi:uncharacterized protein LOC116430798 [Nomia melanderi]|uniref:uncharacterized protein LOC116430798 n=1 Tax=Nomia melanderi TaxID=2448451 RepID=UPI003FCC6BAD